MAKLNYKEWDANRDKTHASTIEVMVYSIYHEGKLLDRVGKNNYMDITKYSY